MVKMHVKWKYLKVRGFLVDEIWGIRSKKLRDLTEITHNFFILVFFPLEGACL